MKFPIGGRFHFCVNGCNNYTFISAFNVVHPTTPAFPPPVVNLLDSQYRLSQVHRDLFSPIDSKLVSITVNLKTICYFRNDVETLLKHY